MLRFVCRLTAIFAFASVALFAGASSAMGNDEFSSFKPKAPFQATSCPGSLQRMSLYGFELTNPELAANPDAYVQCGYVTVPERHAKPDGRTIQVAVAVVKAHGRSRLADPIVYLDGNPGVSSISRTLPFLLTGLGNDSQRSGSREIVLIEQRGTHYSRPALTCPEVNRAMQPIIRRTLDEAQIPEPTADEKRATLIAAYAECYSRLQKEGIDLSAYNSLEIAADVPMVVRALGYDRYNIYAESYGTMVAQHLMRDHPQAIRSVVLNGVMPLDVNVYQVLPATAERIYSDIFRACAEDESCKDAYPNLRAEFETLVDRFNARPTNVGFRTINGDALVNDALEAIGSFGISSFPSRVRLASYGSVRDLVTRFDGIPRGVDNQAFGFAASVICAESADYTMGQVRADNVITRAMANERPREVFEICKAWRVDKLPDYARAAVVSDIPTLLMTGEYDSLTPAHLLPRVAAGLSKSRSLSHSGGQATFLCYYAAFRFISELSMAPGTSCGSSERQPFTILPNGGEPVPAPLVLALPRGTSPGSP